MNIEPQTKFSVVIWDDDSLYLDGLKGLLRAPGSFFKVIVATTDKIMAIQALEDYDIDLFIVDLYDKDEKDYVGLELIKLCRKVSSSTRIVALTAYDQQPELPILAIKYGVNAICYKGGDDVEERLIRAAKGKENYLDPDAARLIQKNVGINIISGYVENRLTAREMEVLNLLAEGATNPQISRQLFISEGTVKSHVESILRKLHLPHRTDARLVKFMKDDQTNK